MVWRDLQTEDQLHDIVRESAEKPALIFKHSTRCSISSMAKSRLERSEIPEGVDFYYLDLIKYRPVSNQIANMFNITHQSPQVLLIKDGKCVYDESHNGILMDEVASRI